MLGSVGGKPCRRGSGNPKALELEMRSVRRNICGRCHQRGVGAGRSTPLDGRADFCMLILNWKAF